MRKILFSATLLIATGAALAPAVAESPYCRPLRQELAALERSAPSGRNNNQIRRELDAARRDARQAGCRRGFLFFQRNNSRACNAIFARINRLERRLSDRGSFSGSRRSARENEWERQRILRAMSREGCSSRRGSGQTYASSGYRTICVRMCDGYYFPLSFSTSPGRLSADQQQCAAMYPPGEAMLFYYPNNGEVAQASSITGETYGSQPFAFGHLQAYQPACAARLQQGLAALAERMGASPLAVRETPRDVVAPPKTDPSIPIPIVRADPAEDPETLANRTGGLRLAPGEKGRDALVARAPDGTRMVGNPFVFAQSNAGPPPTVPGYVPPAIKDFRKPQQATILPRIE